MKKAIALAAVISVLSFPAVSFELIEEPLEPEKTQPRVIAIKAPENPSEHKEAEMFPWAEKIDDVTITYYCTCEKCCGKDDGITANGSNAIPGETCAVDPGVIPLGSCVIIDYGGGNIQHLIANDTGSAINGGRIDVCVGSHEEALAMGVRKATVYYHVTD